MPGSKNSRFANFRADYATHEDFCEVFEKDTEPLYLLAFLLTANHKESEQCFGSTVEETRKEQAVFKEWARSWVKRRLIENAIKIVSPISDRKGGERDFWNAAGSETQRQFEIDTVTKLAPVERFVFVMSILERYSNSDCSLLLGCSMKRVAQARVKALRRLPELAALLPEGDEMPVRRLEVPA